MNVEIRNKHLTARISSFGAELQSLVLNETGREYIWYGTKEIWSGKSPILFPTVGMLLDGKYRFNGKEYRLNKHGFARNSDFEFEKPDEKTARFMLYESEKTLESYPFRFKLEIVFELCVNTLKVTHNVTNTGENEMYFSFGAHPAFNVKNEAKIVFDEKENLVTSRMDENGIITDEKEKIVDNSNVLEIDEKTFLKDALIFENVKSKSGVLYEGEKKLLRFDWGDAPYLGFWAKPGAPYVCIEPWYGVNDDYCRKSDISQKVGIQKLNAGKTFSYAWSAEIF